MLLHGLPEFWWAWRHQVLALAEAGYRAAALDLRGFGASDKPPTGYDVPTACADVAGVVRSLGADSATVVGHGLGGLVAWSMPYLGQVPVRAVGSIGMPHPRVLRQLTLSSVRQLTRRSYVGGLGLRRTLPSPSELAASPDTMAAVLRDWAAPDSAWPSAEEARRYTEALTIPFAAHCAAEYQRWLARTPVNRSGRLLAARTAERIPLPVLQIRGDLDRTLPESWMSQSSGYVSGEQTLVVVEGVGHFPHEEAPARVNRQLVSWLDGLDG